MNHLLETILKPQQDANYKTVQRQTARTLSEINGQKKSPPASSLFYVQNDTGRNMAAPTYALQDVDRTREETYASQLDLRGPACGMTRIKASPSYDRSSTSAQRQRSPTPCRRPSQQQSALQFDKTNAASSNPSAARNKSTECSVMQANVAKAGNQQPARTTTGGSSRRPTSSATVTKCTRPAPRPPPTSHPLQRHVHAAKTFETEPPPTKTVPTYSIKKPLPHKADCATLRSRVSATKHSASSACTSPSSSSLLTQTSNPHWRHDDIDDDHEAVRADKLISDNVSRTSSRAQLAPRSPTPKPSIRQLKDDGRGHGMQQQARADFTLRHLLQQPYANGQQQSKARSCSKGSRDDAQSAEAGGTVRSHSSGSEKGVSVPNRYDNHYYTPEQCQQVCHDQVNSPTHHVQAARKSPDSVPGTQQQQQQKQPMEPHRQTSDLKSSTSRESVSTYRAHHRTSRTSRRPPPTTSVLTFAIDEGRPATKPVPVAPSGPAGHHRASRIPTPKSGPRPVPSSSMVSMVSRCSSVVSLHPEYNHARPMPIERIPFSKFGMECIVPLARQAISIMPVEAFCITGVSGQRKRFLPLTENIVEDFWERAESALAPLPISKAQYDGGEHSCIVSLIASLVARPIANAATQTHKSVLLSTDSHKRTEHRPAERKSTERIERKRTRSPRKEHPPKPEDNNEDYAGLLVRIVQLLYLQTKLNASKADKKNSSKGDKNNSAGNDAGRSAKQSAVIHGKVSEERQRNMAPQATEQKNTAVWRPYSPQHYTAPRATQQQNNMRPYSPQQGDRGNRIGPSVTQAYSRNYPDSRANDESTNNWNNDIKARNGYFDNAQSGTKQWSGYQTATAADFKPNYSPRDQYDYPYDTRLPPHQGMRYSYGFRPTTNNY